MMDNSPRILTAMFVPSLVKQLLSLPDASTQTGNLLKDRFDSNLYWYTPGYMLAADRDDLFSFEANRSGVDQSGNPFHKGRLTLGLKKVIPDDVQTFQAANPNVHVEEIQMAGFTATLNITFQDSATGLMNGSSYSGLVTAINDSSLKLAFENILGSSVIILYQNLVNGGAEVSLTGGYDAWHRQSRIRYRVRWSVNRLAPMVGKNVMMQRVEGRSTPIFPATTNSHSPRGGFPIPVPEPMADDIYVQGSSSLAFKLALGTKYASNLYTLKFVIDEGTSTRPIISIDDLKSFNLRQSEFQELTALGDVSQRYSSLSRLYLGVLSKTIIVIPSHYAIVRNTLGAGGRCMALVDSASSAVSQCKFLFTLLIAPDINPTEMAQLAQEINDHPDLKNYTLKLPAFLKEGSSPKLLTAFQSSSQYSTSIDPYIFALTVEIKDEGENTPAVANANLFIRQLCLEKQPYLFGTISLKLDDHYPEPVETTVVLNFRETSGTDELTFSVDDVSQKIEFLNRSPFDLILTRYALCTPGKINIFPANQILANQSSVSIPLPEEYRANHRELTILADRDLALQGAIPKSQLNQFLVFEAKDVQRTQYRLGVNTKSVNFEGRGIEKIDVQVMLADLPDVEVPPFSLSKLSSIDGTTILIPLDNAITSLQSTVQLTIHFNDPQKTVASAREYDFIDQPILLLEDSDFG